MQAVIWAMLIVFLYVCLFVLAYLQRNYGEFVLWQRAEGYNLPYQSTKQDLGNPSFNNNPRLETIAFNQLINVST